MSPNRSGMDYVQSHDALGRAGIVRPSRTRAKSIVRWPRKVGFRAPFVRIALRHNLQGLFTFDQPKTIGARVREGSRELVIFDGDI